MIGICISAEIDFGYTRGVFCTAKADLNEWNFTNLYFND